VKVGGRARIRMHTEFAHFRHALKPSIICPLCCSWLVCALWLFVDLLTVTAPHPQDPFMINVGLTPFTTTASALSLLLVFRTNASYGRWWEARKVSEPFASATPHSSRTLLCIYCLWPEPCVQPELRAGCWTRSAVGLSDSTESALTGGDAGCGGRSGVGF
jgi:hypothetical protein